MRYKSATQSCFGALLSIERSKLHAQARLQRYINLIYSEQIGFSADNSVDYFLFAKLPWELTRTADIDLLVGRRS